MLPAPAPVVVVQEDLGGRVADFAARVDVYLHRRVAVRIEGTCASACTMVLAVPSIRLCAGPAAELHFHQAYLPNPADPFDTSNRTEGGTALLMRHYPKRVRDWIAGRGGLTKDMIVLRGGPLRALIRACR